MSGRGVEEAVEQIRVDEQLAHRVVDQGAPALGGFELTDDEASAVVDALRLDVGAGSEVEGFSFSWGASLDNLIGVGRQLGVQTPGGTQSAGWIEHGRGSEGWIDRPGQGGLVS
jgi:hypothetical protein